MDWRKEFDEQFEVVDGRVCFDDAGSIKDFIEDLLSEKINKITEPKSKLKIVTEVKKIYKTIEIKKISPEIIRVIRTIEPQGYQKHQDLKLRMARQEVFNRTINKVLKILNRWS